MEEEIYQYHAMWTSVDGAGFAQDPYWNTDGTVCLSHHPWDAPLKLNSRKEAQAFVDERNKELEGNNPWSDHWKVRPAW